MNAKITKRAVDSIAPQDRDQFVWDTEVRGFGLKVTSAGAKVYVLQYRFSGRLRRYTIGKHGSPWTPEVARREALRLLGEVADGVDPSISKGASRHVLSLRQLGDRYLKEHADSKKKARSVREDRRLLEKVILPAIGSRTLNDISRSDIARFHHAQRSTPYQANRALSLLSKMFNLAESWGLRSDGTNPCRHVEKFKEQRRQRFLSEIELARLGTTLDELEVKKSEHPSVVLSIRLLLLTGARVSEILTAKWEYFDDSAGVLRLPDSKSGAKALMLGAPAVLLLDSAPHLEGNPYIVPGEKKGRHLVGLQKAWERIRKKAKLEDVRLHDLRHSYASVAAAGNMSLVLIGALLGHKQQATTARYAHLADDPIRAAANRVSSHVAQSLMRRNPPKKRTNE